MKHSKSILKIKKEGEQVDMVWLLAALKVIHGLYGGAITERNRFGDNGIEAVAS